MSRDEPADGDLSRRNYVRYGGAAITGGLLAGCISNSDDSTPESTETADQPEDTEQPEASDESEDVEQSDGETESTDEEPEASGDEPYTVSLSPVGEVTFESPPETVFTRLTHHADMAFALGRGDGINALHAPEYYDGLWNQFVERLPGVSLEWASLYSSWEPDPEMLYELDSDVHLADPAWVTQLGSWDRDDIDEIAERVGPWFGNSLSDRQQTPAEEWADGYEYYGLWEQFEIVAEAFQERERYAELAAVREELLAEIESGLPPESERSSAVMISSADLETIYTYTLSNPGFLTAHTQPLEPRDAFEGSVESGSTIEFETLVEADPDVILFLGGMDPGTSMAETRAELEDDPIAADITAVQNGRVHAQGARYQGPILNLFQLEMTAKQLYPEAFGEWPTYDEGPYPAFPEDEQLFDRQRVADAINGAL